MTEKTELKQIVSDLATPLVSAMGLKIWGIDIIPGGRLKVCVYIDIPEPVAAGNAPADTQQPLYSASLEQCEELSRRLGLALDVEDSISGPWSLEVSSPGLERKFFEPAQLVPYIGDMLEIRLLDSLDDFPNRKSFKGKLVAVDAGSFTLQPSSVSPDGRILPEDLPPCLIPWNSTRSVRRLHIFQVPGKPGKKQKGK